MHLLMSGPLKCLNAILSLLHLLDRKRNPLQWSAIGRPYLALSPIHIPVRLLNCLAPNHLGRSIAWLWCYSVTKIRQFSSQPPDWKSSWRDFSEVRGGGGGSGRSFRKRGPKLLRSCLVWKFPYGNLPKQSSKKFASEPPKLRSLSRSGSMRKLVAELSLKTFWKQSGVAPANQTKERAKTKSSWISPIFVNSGVFPEEYKHDSHWTFVPESPAKSSWTDLSLVWFAGATPETFLKTSSKTSAKQKRDRGCASQAHPRPRLDSQALPNLPGRHACRTKLPPNVH